MVGQARDAVLENVRRNQLATADMTAALIVDHVGGLQHATRTFGEVLHHENAAAEDAAPAREAQLHVEIERFLAQHPAIEDVDVYSTADSHASDGDARSFDAARSLRGTADRP
jgi:hypothetical protein